MKRASHFLLSFALITTLVALASVRQPSGMTAKTQTPTSVIQGHLLFVSDGKGIMMRPDGTQRRVIADHIDFESITASRDGKIIAFSRRRKGNYISAAFVIYDVIIKDLKSGHERNLTQTKAGTTSLADRNFAARLIPIMGRDATNYYTTI
jgi:hypothetical protein